VLIDLLLKLRRVKKNEEMLKYNIHVTNNSAESVLNT
jgi:hypothetical protein